MSGTLCAVVLEAKGSEDLLSRDARQFVCGLVVYASSRRGEAKAAIAPRALVVARVFRTFGSG